MHHSRPLPLTFEGPEQGWGGGGGGGVKTAKMGGGENLVKICTAYFLGFLAIIHFKCNLPYFIISVQL